MFKSLQTLTLNNLRHPNVSQINKKEKVFEESRRVRPVRRENKKSDKHTTKFFEGYVHKNKRGVDQCRAWHLMLDP